MTIKTAFGQILDQPRGTDGRYQPVQQGDKPLKTAFGVIVDEQDDEDAEDEKDEEKE